MKELREKISDIASKILKKTFKIKHKYKIHILLLIIFYLSMVSQIKIEEQFKTPIKTQFGLWEEIIVQLIFILFLIFWGIGIYNEAELRYKRVKTYQEEEAECLQQKNVIK